MHGGGRRITSGQSRWSSQPRSFANPPCRGVNSFFLSAGELSRSQRAPCRRRQRRCGLAVAVGQRRVAAALQQQPPHLRPQHGETRKIQACTRARPLARMRRARVTHLLACAHRGIMQRRLAVRVLRQQQRSQSVTNLHRYHPRARRSPHLRVDVGAGGQQQHGRVRPAAVGREMQRGAALRVAAIHRRAGLQRRAQALQVAMPCQLVQAGAAAAARLRMRTRVCKSQPAGSAARHMAPPRRAAAATC